MSQTTLKAAFPLLLCIGLAIPLAGCKSIGFEKPTLPSLAFWKKDRDSELPPPPARHFDPSRFDADNSAPTQVADDSESYNEYGIKNRTADIKAELKRDLNAAKDSLAKKYSSKSASPEGKAPRQPYNMDDFSSGTKDSLASAKNSFDLNAAKIKEKFDAGTSQAENGLSAAQQKFRNAMNSTISGGDATASKSNSSNSFAPKDNGFAAKPNKKSASGFGGFDSSQFSAATKSIAAKKDSLEPKTSRSMYDINGKLRSAASELKKQANSIQSPANSKLKSEFEKRIAASQSNFDKGSTAANKQLEALASVSKQTRQAIRSPFPKMSSQDGPTMPTTLKPGLTPNSTSGSFQLTKPNQIAGINPMANGSIKSMRSEVEEARRQIAQLKKQIAAKAKTAPATPPTTGPGPNQFGLSPKQLGASSNRFGAQTAQPPTAPNTIEGIVLPLDNAKNSTTPGAPNRIASKNSQFGSGSSNTFVPARSTIQPKNQPALKPREITPNGGSFYPATPYGGFGAKQTPTAKAGQLPQGTHQFESFVPPPNQSKIGQVGFASDKTNGPVGQHAVADVPVESSTPGVHRANSIETYVPEVRIPASILTGNSSFTPGSTKPMKR